MDVVKTSGKEKLPRTWSSTMPRANLLQNTTVKKKLFTPLSKDARPDKYSKQHESWNDYFRRPLNKNGDSGLLIKVMEPSKKAGVKSRTLRIYQTEDVERSEISSLSNSAQAL